jgi:molybdopterin synthase sulfur carrier subunit
MKVLCFGIAKDIVGGSTVEFDADAINSVQSLRSYLNETYPQFKEYNTYRIAVNQAFASEQDVISAQDEIAIIPPVSGG